MPSFFRQGMASVSAMALNFNAGVYGDAAVAAMAIVTKVFNFLLSAVIGFGQGMQPVVGYNYGAKELGRVRQAVSFSLKFCTVILTVAAAAGAVFAAADRAVLPKRPRGGGSGDTGIPIPMYLTAPGGGAGLCQYAVPVSGQILAGVAAGLVQAGDVFYPPWCICCPCTLGCWVWR